MHGKRLCDNKEAMRRSVFLLCALALVGCQPKAIEGEGGRLSAPAAGSARLIVAKVKETPETVHYQWSLLGERNWTTPTVTGTQASLAEVYPLNDPKRQGGCNTWLCDAIFTKQGAGWEWTLRLHGSNGKTAETKGTCTDMPEVQLTKDTEASLPATLTLAKAGSTTLTLTVPK